MYLPLLEDQAHYLIFTRPRRFGKSLFSGYAPQLL
ncbi:AAA family ATPase [Phocaeicola massiliensis]|nr:AAA family ATPase [Phocaeicola massiliensis]